MVFTQLIFILVVGAIGGIVWFAYQAKYSQEQLKSSRGARNSERKEHNRKQPKTRQAPAALVAEPENVKEAAESEPEPEPEPEPVAKKGKKNKKKPEEKKVAEKKPQAKAAPVQAAPAKKAAAKASSAPAQTAAPKKPVEEKKEAKTEQKTKKNKTDKIKNCRSSKPSLRLSWLQPRSPRKGLQRHRMLMAGPNLFLSRLSEVLTRTSKSNPRLLCLFRSSRGSILSSLAPRVRL